MKLMTDEKKTTETTQRETAQQENANENKSAQEIIHDSAKDNQKSQAKFDTKGPSPAVTKTTAVEQSTPMAQKGTAATQDAVADYRSALEEGTGHRPRSEKYRDDIGTPPEDVKNFPKK